MEGVSDDKVVSLHDMPIAGLRQPDAKCVEMIEGLLEEAKDGRLRVFCFAAMTSDGFHKSNWNGAAAASATMIAGILSRLTYEFNKALHDHDFGGD